MDEIIKKEPIDCAIHIQIKEEKLPTASSSIVKLEHIDNTLQAPKSNAHTEKSQYFGHTETIINGGRSIQTESFPPSEDLIQIKDERYTDMKLEITEECVLEIKSEITISNDFDIPSSSQTPFKKVAATSSVAKKIEKKKRFLCPVCQKYFPTSASRKHHVGCQFGERCFTCKLCGQFFMQRSLYMTHYFKHFVKRFKHDQLLHGTRLKGRINSNKTKISKYTIGFHEYILKLNLNRYIIKRGIRTKQVYQCKVCFLEFSRMCHFVRHMKYHRLAKSFDCVVCLKDFSMCGSKHHLRLMTKTVYSCRYCNTSFKNRRTLNQHTLKHTTKKKKRIKMNVEILWCKICLIPYNKKKNYDEHMLTHNEKTEFKCKVCFVQFKQEQVFNSHLSINSVQEPYRCDSCSQEYTLKCHQFTNCNRTKVKCRICSQVLNYARDLIKHMESHVDVNQFICKYDDRLRTHDAKTEFKCTVCSKLFKEKQVFYTHILMNYLQEPYRCDVCSREYTLKCHQFTTCGKKENTSLKFVYGC